MADPNDLLSSEGLDNRLPVEGLDLLPPEPGPFKQGLGAGIAGVKSSLGGAAALAAHGIGAVAPAAIAEPAAAAEQAALDYAAEQGEIASQGMRSYTDVDWTSPSAIAEHFKRLLGNALPSLALMFAGGAAGGVLGRGLGAVAKTAPATARTLSTAGMYTGALAPSVALEAGGIYPEALETGVENPALRAAVGGAVSGATDLLPFMAAGRYIKAAGKVGGFGAMAKKAAIGIPLGGTLEGSQELTQSVIQRVAAGKDLADPEAVTEYIDSFLGGFAPGMVFGGAVGALRGRKAPAAAGRELPPPEPAPTVSAEAPISPPAETRYPLSAEDEASIAHANLVTAHDAAAAQAATIEAQLAEVQGKTAAATARLAELKAEDALPIGERRTKAEIVAERRALQAQVKEVKAGVEKLGGELNRARKTVAELAPQLAAADEREAARVALANTPTGLNPAISPKLGTESPNLGRFAEPATPQEKIDRAVKGVHALFREQGMPLTTTMESLATPIMSPREAALAKVEERAPRETVKGPSTAQMQAVEPHAMQVIEPMAAELAKAKTQTEAGQAKIATNLAAAMREVVQEAAKLGSVTEAQAHIVNRMPAALKGHGVAADAEDIAKAVSAAVGQAETVYSRGAVAPKTAAFKKWFGKSKVVDAQGKPLVVYHGAEMGGNFSVFDVPVSQHHVGPGMNDVMETQHFFFSDDRATARSYGPVKSVYLSMQNPLVVDAKGASYKEFVPYHYIGAALKGGHDGVMVRNIRDDAMMRGAKSTSYIAFRPEQIKSTTNERPTGSPDINQSNAALTQDEFDALPPQGQNQVVDTYNQIMAAKGAALIANLKGLIGNDPHLTITTFQAKPGDPIGSYTRVGPLKSLIALATNAKDGLSVADHEGYHYAEERLLNSEERAVVRNALLPGRPLYEQLMGKVRQYDLENQTNLADEVSGSPREAHAYAFEFWRRGELQAEGRLARAWEKIKAVLRQIAQAITGQGFTTIEDVFTALDRGQFAERQAAGHYGDAINGPDGVPAMSGAAIPAPAVLRVDNPGGSWLQEKRATNITDGKGQWGQPARFGSVTGSYDRAVLVPVEVLAKIPGMSGEQQPGRTRVDALEGLKKHMAERGRLPAMQGEWFKGKDYAPFIQVDQDGNPWVNEGNHRIMAAKALGWKYLPTEIRYFTGGEAVNGVVSPANIAMFEQQAAAEQRSLDEYRSVAGSAGWYRSALTDQVSQLPMKSGTAQAWRDQIKGLVNKGLVKQAEIDAVGLEEWLTMKGEPREIAEPGFGLVEEWKGLDGKWEQVDDLAMYARTAEELVITERMKIRSRQLARDDDFVDGRIVVKAFPDLSFGKVAPASKLTKDEVVSYLRENGVRVEEMVLGETGQFTQQMQQRLDWLETNRDDLTPEQEQERSDLISDENAASEPGQGPAVTKYADYQLPGGTQYRELLLTLPTGEKPFALPAGWKVEPWAAQELPLGWTLEQRAAPGGVPVWRAVHRADRGGVVGAGELLEVMEAPDRGQLMALVTGQSMYQVLDDGGFQRGIGDTAAEAIQDAGTGVSYKKERPGLKFTAPHFGEYGKNLLAHVRLNSRVDASGAKVLFLEEIQSDWGTAWRKVQQWDRLKAEGARLSAAMTARENEITPDWTNRPGQDMSVWGRDSALQELNRQYMANEAKLKKLGARPPEPSHGPFTEAVDAWTALVLKRMIRYAIETGHEKIAWTTGIQQVERWTGALRKHVDAIEWTKTKDGVQLVGYKNLATGTRVLTTPAITARFRAALERNNWLGFDEYTEARDAVLSHADWADRWEVETGADRVAVEEYIAARGRVVQRNKVVDTNYQENELSDAIGKAMADRIRQDPNPTGTIEGENIKIDDTGMAGFYERIVPKVANEVLKKLDKTVKVGEVEIKIDGTKVAGRRVDEVISDYLQEGASKQPGFQLTPELVRNALNGLPLFSRAAAAPGAVVNIGLKVGETGAITPEEALAALQSVGISVQVQTVRNSATEPTLVAQLDRALTPAEAHHLAVQLKQEAIAQVAGGVGELYGPNAAAWQPFNPAYFLDLPQYSRAAINPALPAYGRARPGSVSVPAVHFSPNSSLTRLESSRYGTGLKGAERARGAGPRVHFYVPQGYGVQNEAGTGEHAYGVMLANLYDADVDPQRLWAQGGEAAVEAAGFDGYLARGSSTAVLLGKHSVPVLPIGLGVKAVNAQLGGLSIPPAVYDQNRLLAEDLIRDRRLPGGQLRPSEWQDVIRKVAPDLYARLPTSIYEGTAPVYRDQLIGTFYKNAPVDPTGDGLGRVLQNLTTSQQVSYSRAAITANADMAREMSAGELQQAQLFQTSAKMMEDAMDRGPDNLGKLALGALSTEVSGGISRWWQKNIATPNFVSRISRGYRNVFQVLNTYVRYRNDLVERMLIQKIPQWYTASSEDQHVTFNALNKRNVEGYAGDSQELRELLSGLTPKQRGMFLSATQMFEGFLRMELEADKAFHQRVYVTPGLYEKWLAERSAQVQELIDKGYMPLRRYGDHSVRVTMDTRSADGRPEQLVGALQWFGTARAAYATAKIYEEEIKRSGVDLKVEVGLNYKAARDVTISAEQFLDTARRNGVPLTAMEKERLVKALTSADSLTRNRMLHREGMPGYSTDGMRVMNEFGMRMAGKLAYSRFASAIDAASDGRAVTTDVVGGVPQIEIDLHREGESVDEFKARNLWKLEGPMSGFHHNLADELTDYVLVPDHTGGWSRKLRGAAMMYFIGGSLSAGVVNTMSVPMMVVPELSIHTDYATALSTTLGAWKTTWQYQHILRDIERLKSNEAADAIPGVSPDLRAALVEAAQYTMDTELHQIMGISQGAMWSQNQRVQRAMKTWMAPFRITEQTNRITSFIAAYKVASTTGVRQADGSFRRLSGVELFRFARDMIDSTQNNYNETNRPGAARNPIYALMFMFKSFPLFMTEAIVLMAKANPKSAVYMLLGLTAMTGVQGLPFAETIQDLIDTIAQQLFGSPFNTRRAMRNMIKTASEAMTGYDASELVLRGVINGVLGVSASSRIGAGDFVPGTRLGAAEADQGRVLQEVIGAPYAMVKDTAASIGKFGKGVFTGDWKDTADALRAGGPIAVRNAIKGVEQLSNGYASDSKGRKLVDINGMNAMLQMGGLSSAALARTYELESINRQTKAFHTQVSTDMKDKLVRAMKEGDTERVQEINDLRSAWNAQYPEMPIMVNPSALRRDLALSGLPMDRRSQLLWSRRIRGANVFSEQ